MRDSPPPGSARRDELLDAAYDYVLVHGMGGLSLRPLAAAIGSSPRVLLYLFGSKDALLREVLGRARADELAGLARVRATSPVGLLAAAEEVWGWLADPRHAALLVVWLESYSRSLVEPGGPWADFAAATVRDWRSVLVEVQGRKDADAEARATAVLALLRGGLLDLLATGDRERVDTAVRAALRAVA
jgi:AcrR family transcriptional regulator